LCNSKYCFSVGMEENLENSQLGCLTSLPKFELATFSIKVECVTTLSLLVWTFQL
jgi:hypothetical protein